MHAMFWPMGMTHVVNGYAIFSYMAYALPMLVVLLNGVPFKGTP